MAKQIYINLLKRFLDFSFSILSLPIVFLVIVIFSPLIFINDFGPIFYFGYRMGKNGRKFKMIKFRSMKVNSLDIRNEDGSTFNSNDDPRVTKIGRFIRKTSIDELPQVFNVLIGDMSFVGPRPTLFSDKYLTFDAQTKKRFIVRPGITGYTQAYFRNSIGQEEKFKQDAWYVDNISFSLDVKIVVQTIISVVKREKIFTNSAK